MALLTDLERKLIETGFDSLSVFEQNQFIISYASQMNVNYLNVTAENILNHQKKMKKEIFNEYCEEEIIKGFVSKVNGHHYRTNRDDQINLIGQKDEVMEDPTMITVYWKTEDAGYIPHTREDWLKIYREAFAYKKAILFRNDNLKGGINAAVTSAEVAAIKWELEL